MQIPPAFDTLDKAILDELQRNARIANKALARLVGLSESACRQRVKRLEQAGVIRDYRARLNHVAIDANFEAWVLLQLRDNNMQTRERLRRAIEGAEFVLEAYEIAGPVDVLVRVVAASVEDWRSFADRLERDNLLASARLCLVQSELKALSPILFK